MNRDPFNIRRSPLPAFQLLRNGADTLQRTASQASQRIVSAIGELDDEIGQKKKIDDDDGPETRLEDSSVASTMSYALPQNGPTQRHPDQWSRAGQNGHSEGIGEKMNNMWNPERRDSLPMYKDKPFGHSSRKSAWKKKRTVGLVLGSLAGLSWWFGVLSPLSYLSGDGDVKTASSKSSSSSWSLFGSSKPTTNWDDRAQTVKEAFQLSWSGYEKYAWGMFCWLGRQVFLDD
jgi:mannosyl-oligosaccharide alpha-1,2-mannosidase